MELNHNSINHKKKAFDLDQITKKFYDQFKKEHHIFLGFIQGISVKFDQEWYASLMLNRLMFIYFIQKKGFLDGDLNYLQHKLNQIRSPLTPLQKREKELEKTPLFKGGRGDLTFYRYFLLRLFQEGLGQENKTTELEKLLGKVPYLNCGLFEIHPLEKTYPDLNINDEAFSQIFNFFNQYDWHLDEHSLNNDQEINPDVLGYIFEKYINQKQMGAYYTKEDITEYISKNCIIPYLFDQVLREYNPPQPPFKRGEKEQEKAPLSQGYNPQKAPLFKGGLGGSNIWNLLKINPDRYIYEAVKKGVDLPLPADIAIGLNDVSKRENWHKLTDQNYGLPTELWREYISRRNRYQDIKQKLENGEVNSINDFITYNLNIRQFAQDFILNIEDPILLKIFYQQLEQISILDPTCGSGAFLFSALNILESLYHSCLERMRFFVEDDPPLPPFKRGEKEEEKVPFFKEDLGGSNTDINNQNRRYFILKKIILNNLYGVDIMESAIEICKLRLFLKLLTQITPNPSLPNFGIEVLPNLDFNIRWGNSLVGFVNYQEVKKTVQGDKQTKLDLFNDLTQIDQKIRQVNESYQQFKKIQSQGEIKAVLQESFNSLNEELNGYLAKEYGINIQKKKDFKKWLISHQPFHWFVEFSAIINKGGFDVIIGNPPYIEYSKVKNDYQIKGYQTEKCGNLSAFIIERNNKLLQSFGLTGMIIPHSAICTDRMETLQLELTNHGNIWLSSYCIRPSKLFDGVDHRLAIYIMKKQGDHNIYSSKYHRWYQELRNSLFTLLEYTNITQIKFTNSFPKLHNVLENRIWYKLIKFNSLNQFLDQEKTIYFHNAPRYWIRSMNFIPYFWNEKDGEKISSQVKSIALKTDLDALTLVAILNSCLFYWWFILLSDCRHLNSREINNFPVGLDKMSNSFKAKLAKLAQDLMIDLQDNSVRKNCNYKATGKVIYDEYYPKYSKSIIDEIDQLLAEHYGLTEEELDFIINYEIKYRMGKELEEDEKKLLKI